MDLAVRGKRVLITAAGAGIGLAMADMFLAHGARVHICDVDAARLDACQMTRPHLTISRADVSDPDQVDQLFDDAIGHFGGLDVLINNAGIAGPTAAVEEVTPAAWNRTLAVNINGQFYCARQAVPWLKTAGGGGIINIASTAGLLGYPFRTPYAASKWAVVGFTKSLAMELGEFGIQVNAICPGSVEGPRMEAVITAEAGARGVSPEAVRQGYQRQTSMRTFVTPDDIAHMALFLCTEAGRKISGQALCVDGHTETLQT